MPLYGWTVDEVKAAVERAYEENVFAGFRRVDDRGGFAYGEYWSLREVIYHVSPQGCDCPARTVCKHMAGLALMTGTMTKLWPHWYTDPRLAEWEESIAWDYMPRQVA